MTEPVPAPVIPGPVAKPSRLAKVVALVTWARSAEGRKDIGAAIAVATAIYTALHRAGV